MTEAFTVSLQGRAVKVSKAQWAATGGSAACASRSASSRRRQPTSYLAKISLAPVSDQGDRGRGKLAFAQLLLFAQAYIEGPYGAPMIDLHGATHTCFLIITSGMGWTFLRAWKRQLLQEAARGRTVHVLRSVAIMRHHDRHLAAEFSGWDASLEDGAELPAELHAQVRTLLTCAVTVNRRDCYCHSSVVTYREYSTAATSK